MLQTPPPFSAVKVAGTPLHRLARRGEQPSPVPPRQVTVYSIDWNRPEPARLLLRVRCSSGTYVRALVHDMGRGLGCGAHVTALRRVASGPFGIEQALRLEEAVSLLERGELSSLLGVGEALPGWPRLVLDSMSARQLAQGQAVDAPPPECEGLHLAVSPEGSVFAIAEWDGEQGRWKPKKVLSQESDA